MQGRDRAAGVKMTGLPARHQRSAEEYTSGAWRNCCEITQNSINKAKEALQRTTSQAPCHKLGVPVERSRFQASAARFFEKNVYIR